MLRRQLLRALGPLALAFTTVPTLLHKRIALADANSATTLSERELDILADLAYRLLPLLEPRSPVYQLVGRTVQRQAEQSTELANMLRAGLDELSLANQRPWLELPTEQRTATIQSQYPSPFLGLVRWRTCEQVLRDPQVWSRLGYQGSSIEYGGYLHRGFDDIDWLPAKPAGADQ